MFELVLQSSIICPACGHREREIMPTDACQYFYDCKGCGEVLKPKAGDCCVFCSYGDMPCPPIQGARIEGRAASCCSGAGNA
jgi:hypothetical protein